MKIEIYKDRIILIPETDKYVLDDLNRFRLDRDLINILSCLTYDVCNYTASYEFKEEIDDKS